VSEATIKTRRLDPSAVLHFEYEYSIANQILNTPYTPDTQAILRK
jgi:hypothetical protein